MSDAHVYIPATPEQLAALGEEATLSPAPQQAFAATPAVQRLLADEDEEMWEFTALQDAAETAAQAGPLVVVAAQLPQSAVTACPGDTAEVRLTGEVPLRRVSAIFVGDDVLGTGPAVVSVDEEIELSWYHPSELPEVLALLRRS